MENIIDALEKVFNQNMVLYIHTLRSFLVFHPDSIEEILNHLFCKLPIIKLGKGEEEEFEEIIEDIFNILKEPKLVKIIKRFEEFLKSEIKNDPVVEGIIEVRLGIIISNDDSVRGYVLFFEGVKKLPQERRKAILEEFVESEKILKIKDDPFWICIQILGENNCYIKISEILDQHLNEYIERGKNASTEHEFREIFEEAEKSISSWCRILLEILREKEKAAQDFGAFFILAEKFIQSSISFDNIFSMFMKQSSLLAQIREVISAFFYWFNKALLSIKSRDYYYARGLEASQIRGELLQYFVALCFSINGYTPMVARNTGINGVDELDVICWNSKEIIIVDCKCTKNYKHEYAKKFLNKIKLLSTESIQKDFYKFLEENTYAPENKFEEKKFSWAVVSCGKITPRAHNLLNNHAKLYPIIEFTKKFGCKQILPRYLSKNSN